MDSINMNPTSIYLVLFGTCLSCSLVHLTKKKILTLLVVKAMFTFLCLSGLEGSFLILSSILIFLDLLLVILCRLDVLDELFRLSPTRNLPPPSLSPSWLPLLEKKQCYKLIQHSPHHYPLLEKEQGQTKNSFSWPE